MVSNFLVDPACRLQNRDLNPGRLAPKPVPHATAWKAITSAHDAVRRSAGRRAFTVPGNGSGQASRRVQARSESLDESSEQRDVVTSERDHSTLH